MTPYDRVYKPNLYIEMNDLISNQIVGFGFKVNELKKRWKLIQETYKRAGVYKSPWD